MRLNRFKNIDWKADSKIDLEASFLNNSEGIDTDWVVIVPTLQSGRHGKSETLKEVIKDGKNLLLELFKIQAPYVKEKDPRFIITNLTQDGKDHRYFDGIGLYRLGLKGKIPSFFIGGFNDFAGNTLSHRPN